MRVFVVLVALAMPGLPVQALAATRVLSSPPASSGALTQVAGRDAGQTAPAAATVDPQPPDGYLQSLADLLAEAARNNPDVRAAQQAWLASTRIAPQVSTLPDPQVVVQHMPVGSPLPFSDFTTNNFAYIALGFSQTLPFPGKLALRGQAARQESDATRAGLDVVRRRVRADLKVAYARLAGVQRTLAILQRDDQLLHQIERIAEARYRVGQGTQQDVIEAQLQRTKLLRDVAVQQQQRDILEAQLKQLLGRSQTSPDLVVAPLAATPVSSTLDDLLQLAQADNPGVRASQALARASETRVALAHKAFDPDFTAQFMWQHTAARFPDYYMYTFSARVPLYWRHRQVPGLAEATDRLASAQQGYTTAVQQAQAQLRDQFARMQTASRLLTIYRDGLIPQANAAFRAGLADYQSGRLDFQSLLKSFVDVLTLETAYWQTLSDHETAVARIEQVAGANLP